MSNAVPETDEGDRLRRLSAIMRFLGHIRESADERELVHAIIQAAAVWYDLDARAYRRELNGRFVLDAWLPGTDVASDPQELDVLALVSREGPTHISSLAEIEQLGWRTIQGEVSLLPIVAADQVRRLVVVSGAIGRDIEATLMLVCRSAGSVLEQFSAKRGRDVQERLARRIAEVRGPFQSCVRAVVEEFVSAVGAAGARVAVKPANQRALTLFSTGNGWTSEPVPPLGPDASEIGMARIALAFGLGNDSTAVIELLAPGDRTFSLDNVNVARVGGRILSVWLSGISVGASQRPVDRAEAPAVAPFEDRIHEELSRARRLSLSGGVLVATVPGTGGVLDTKILSTVIRTVRAELRSSDLLGQLATGDIAAVLVRTNSDGVARAALRVRQRLEAQARMHQLPAVVVGHALYPAGGVESPAALVNRARQDAGLMFS